MFLMDSYMVDVKNIHLTAPCFRKGWDAGQA